MCVRCIDSVTEVRESTGCIHLTEGPPPLRTELITLDSCICSFIYHDTIYRTRYWQMSQWNFTPLSAKSGPIRGPAPHGGAG